MGAKDPNAAETTDAFKILLNAKVELLRFQSSFKAVESI